jgi:hypothetical protein
LLQHRDEHPARQLARRAQSLYCAIGLTERRNAIGPAGGAISDCARREREAKGKQMIKRQILEQTRRNGDDLAAVKSRLDRVEQKVDGAERKVDGLERKFDGLSRNLPKLIS